MRFLANGPSIPDELLIARDEGRVIFFCGAGVSRARAELSDFFGLAARVVEALGVEGDDPVCRIIEEARELDRRTGIPGLISADRIFGLLEREFLTRDIEAAVAKALKPRLNADLSAHRIMLDLGRSREGKVRLVTTNFDLLFEACDNNQQSSNPPRLPDPKRPDEFEGIIHLHGCVDEEYQGASGDGFVLSSSEFGHAYLADGWATQFIRSILERYVVVFVGYAADDPPVHYLLEALNKRPNSSQRMYAFQVGTQDEAETRWRHKGVVPIAYDETEGHASLWDTLAAWAVRALDPDAWYGKTINMAKKGPEALLPHERGQVAHLVSFLEGVKSFANSDPLPPADWLCVFDPNIRYLKPARLGSYHERGPFFDPFEAYGLESDPVPQKVDPEDFHAKREIPLGVWSCFTPTTLDLLNLQDSNYAALKGYYSVNSPTPPLRLLHVGQWICSVSDQPAAVWWASHQVGIHGEIQSKIRFELEKRKDCSSIIRRAWHYIFEGWKREGSDAYQKWFQLKASIDLDGWTCSAIRDLAGILLPYVKSEWPYWGGPKPPLDKESVQLRDLVNLTVEYPELQEQFHIPDGLLVTAVREFRKNLEYAISLEKELEVYRYLHLSPIEPDPDLSGESYSRHYDISRLFLLFVDLFKRLLALDPLSAKREFQAWWEDDVTVFARLRIWGAGQREILDGAEAGRLLCNLNDEVFWNSRHRRDFLLVLKQRWSDIPAAIRKRLEKRLLRGPIRGEREMKSEYTERRSRESLLCIHWLSQEGCNFSFDLQAESAKLQLLAPEWKQQHATKAAASLESRSGTVQTITDYSGLLGEPLGNLLAKARELSGRDFDSFVEKDPFNGLSSARPVRAFSALCNAAKDGEFPELFWRTFLYSAAREKDRPRFKALVAGRIANLPTNFLMELIHPVSDWLLKSSKILFASYPENFEKVWSKIIEAMRGESVIAKTAIARGNKEPAWATEALNSPVGKLAQATMNDPKKEGLKAGKGFPVQWTNRVEELLDLPGDNRRYALVMFAFNLNWFFYVDPTWTENNFLSVLENDDNDKEALWEGFFWAAKVPDKKLYFRLKPSLLNLVLSNHAVSRREINVLSGILLAGWGRIYGKTGKRFITNKEMRNILLNADDDFRGQIIRHLERWSSGRENDDWRNKLPIFFAEVWPRHKKARSPRISAKLCDLVFSDDAIFSIVADTILPLLTRVETDGFFLPHLRDTKSEIIEKFPEKMLALLWAVLPENATKWPYRIGDVLPKIEEALPSLQKDSRLIELNRRWNAR
jgi:SIR2-like domain